MSDTRFKPGNKLGRQFQPGNPGRPKIYTPEVVWPYLLAARGIKSRALKLMHADDYTISWARLHIVIRENPDLQRKVDEIRAAALENLVEQEFERADRGDQKSAQFLLAKLHQDFKHKTEISGDLLIAAVPSSPLDRLFDGADENILEHGEQVELARLCDDIGPTGNIMLLSSNKLLQFQALINKAKGMPLALPAPEDQ